MSDQAGEQEAGTSDTEAVDRATANGHTMEWDPPHSLSSVARWTCKVCSDAVLQYGSNIYGGAVEQNCEESVAKWKKLGYM